MGAVVDHNLPVHNTQGGSCIFIHIWGPAQTPTGGCTAMAEDHMKEVFTWLNDSKQPVLIQLPKEVYISLQTTWGIPSMSGMLLGI
jgi:L,D-peptidoglycan transpeptidase YkuD (ErfK/YbiS/YcfS/YnhG family)